jgi:hypothetical protein
LAVTFAVVFTASNETVFEEQPDGMLNEGVSLPFAPFEANNNEWQAIKGTAEEAGGTLSIERDRKFRRRGFSSGLSFLETKEIATYAFASAAGLAVFAKNVVGAIKIWRDVRSADRHVKVKIGSEEIEVKPGDDIGEIVKKWESEHNS